ncbi:PREDICTED: WAP four-disulfide core domain protein 1 isoform X2 [Chinchilla lanigera]|uniref:WAP four-disulfide core domain protein 1 isoform X2 n=1 Tax=Chinchilla lanigera TaxID=34839 RepID=UPI00038ECC93|nr:PREDICTED: WAP four-disulfide core domain protein 1 isoform X2 [Chinchilla lanigera]
MGSCGRKVLWALCLLQLLGASSAKDIWRRSLPERLLPERPPVEEAGSPGPQQPRADRCPPPPRTLPPGACQALRCQADSECPRQWRCCYNGCAYSCLEAVPPPPVLDWLVQPKPRWLGGNGWLLDGPEEVLQEACSTTKDGAEPLLCPSGYECHILSPGDVAKGIPNHGQCVKQRQQAGECGRPGLLLAPRSWTPSQSLASGNDPSTQRLAHRSSAPHSQSLSLVLPRGTGRALSTQQTDCIQFRVS